MAVPGAGDSVLLRRVTPATPKLGDARAHLTHPFFHNASASHPPHRFQTPEHISNSTTNYNNSNNNPPYTPAGSDATRLRDDQVKRMSASVRLPRQSGTNIPWPTAIPSTMQKWTNISQVHTMCTAGHRSTQVRMLWLADVPRADRFSAFQHECWRRALASSTEEAYWGSWRSVMQILNIETTPEETKISKLLRGRAVSNPTAFPAPMSLDDARRLNSLFASTLPTHTAITAAAFLLGQRISDMIQVSCVDVTTSTLQPSHCPRLAQDKTVTLLCVITIRRGKTVATSAPYTLFLPLQQWPATQIMRAQAEARQRGDLFIMTPMNTRSEQDSVLATIRMMILETSDRLELRSIRRGGLHCLAADPANTITDLLQLSRHSDSKMLMRYLGWGERSEAHKQTQLKMTMPNIMMLQPGAITTSPFISPCTSSAPQSTF